MTCAQLIQAIHELLGDRMLAAHLDDRHPRVHLAAPHWRELAEYLHDEPTLAFDWLANLAAVDYVATHQLALIVDLRSTQHQHWIAIKVFIDRNQPQLPTVSDLWPAADWHEREAYDLMGITFTNHPDLRRILLPEDWVGHPLRKDYIFPRQYHNIPASYELDWQQQPDYPK